MVEAITRYQAQDHDLGLPGQVILELPVEVFVRKNEKGLVQKSPDGRELVYDNLNTLPVLSVLDEVLTNPNHPEHRRFSSSWNFLREKVNTGKRHGIVLTSLGAITILVASFGFEMQRRQGRDLKHLFRLMEEYATEKINLSPH